MRKTIGTTERVEKSMKEKELNHRQGFTKKIIIIASLILSIFHLYTAGFGLLPPMQQRVFHLAMVLFLVFLIFPASKKNSEGKVPWYDIVLAVTALASNLYIFFVYDSIAYRFDISISYYNVLIGFVALLLLIEGTRRAVGKELVILAVVSILYMFFGNYFPGFLNHRGMSFVRFVEFMAWSPDGPYGIVLQVSATYIFTFVYFGVLIEKTGIGDFFNDFAVALFGCYRGGGAKVSVVSSALMGTISGVAVANVATTGSFTIPLMRKVGYSPSFAAAVEAVASTGGQIMPPIMGASAFIMAGILGIPYFTVIKAAIIPALLYFAAVFLAVDLRAASLGLKGLKKEELPSMKKAMLERGHMLIPVVFLIGLLVFGYSPLFSVFYSIISTLIVSAFSKKTRISLNAFFDSLIEGAQKALPIATACAIVGFTVGMVGTTGLGMALGKGIIELAGDNLFLALIMVAVTSLILGVGLPPTACYIVVAVIAAPVITRLIDVQPIIAHLFVYYYGMLAVITPPVALASFTAAGLVGESPYKVGWTAFKLGIPAYIIPFVFITSPSLMLIDVTFKGMCLGLFRGIVMVIATAIAIEGFAFKKIGYFYRIPLFISSILIMYSSRWSDIAGIFIALSVFLILFLKAKGTKI